MRPIIGITTYVEPATWGVWHGPADDAGSARLRRGGHRRPVAARCCCRRTISTPTCCASWTALVLGGGADLGPALYGAGAATRRPSPAPERDAAEMLLARAALDRDLPVLGVCRGMQLLTVAAGGSLHQHLPCILGYEEYLPCARRLRRATTRRSRPAADRRL